MARLCRGCPGNRSGFLLSFSAFLPFLPSLFQFSVFLHNVYEILIITHSKSYYSCLLNPQEYRTLHSSLAVITKHECADQGLWLNWEHCRIWLIWQEHLEIYNKDISSLGLLNCKRATELAVIMVTWTPGWPGTLLKKTGLLPGEFVEEVTCPLAPVPRSGPSTLTGMQCWKQVWTSCWFHVCLPKWKSVKWFVIFYLVWLWFSPVISLPLLYSIPFKLCAVWLN